MSLWVGQKHNCHSPTTVYYHFLPDLVRRCGGYPISLCERSSPETMAAVTSWRILVVSYVLPEKGGGDPPGALDVNVRYQFHSRPRSLTRCESLGDPEWLLAGDTYGTWPVVPTTCIPRAFQRVAMAVGNNDAGVRNFIINSRDSCILLIASSFQEQKVGRIIAQTPDHTFKARVLLSPSSLSRAELLRV